MGCDPRKTWAPVTQGNVGELPPQVGTKSQAGGNSYILCRAGEDLRPSRIAALDAGGFEANHVAIGSGDGTRYVVVPDTAQSRNVTAGVTNGHYFWGLVEGENVEVASSGVGPGEGPFLVNNVGQLVNASANANNKVAGFLVRSGDNPALCDVLNPIGMGR